MASRDPRLPPESELRPVEMRREAPEALRLSGTQESPSQEPQIWALYPVVSPAARSEPEGGDLVRLLQDAARRGRRFLALGALLGVGFGVAYLLVADAIYVVKTVLHVELRKSVIRDSDARPGSAYVGTQAEVIQSPAMVAEAIRAIGLPEAQEPGLLERLKAWIESLNPFSSDAPVDPVAQAVLATLPLLQASPVLGTDVLTVTLRTRAPERGVRFLDALTASYQAYVRENEAAAHREGLEVLRRREAELAAQIAEVSGRRDAEQSVTRSLGEGQDVLAVQRMSLEEHAKARVAAQRRRIDLQNELTALREMNDARVAPSREIEDELVRAEASLAGLRAKVSDRHPDVQQMEQRVAGLRDQLRLGAKARIEQLEREVRAARRTESALADLYDREWTKVKALEAESASVKRLAHEIDRLEEQRGAVLALMGEKELAVLSAMGGENSGTLVRVLEAPAVPPSPVWPLPLPVLFACGLVGLLGGLGLALVVVWRARAEPEAAADPLAEPARFADSGLAAPPRIAQRRPQEL